MKNFKIVEDMVNVHYNDMQGMFSIDKRENDSIEALCKANGVDTSDYFILGFGFGFGEMRGTNTLQKVTCRVLLLDKEYGTSYDEILENVVGAPSVKVIKKRFTIPVAELGLYIKSFESMAVGEISNHISALEIIEE